MPVSESLQHIPQWTLYLGGVTSSLLLDSSLAKSSVMTDQRHVDPCAVRCLIDRIKQAKVSGQKQEYQRQGRDVNNTRQKSGSQAWCTEQKILFVNNWNLFWELSGVQARRPPSHRQRAPPPFLLDSSTSLHTPVYPHITPSWSQSVDYLYISPPSLCLARLPYPHSLVYVFVVFCVGYCTDYIRFRAFGTPALRCRLGCPVPDYCFVFACWLLI